MNSGERLATELDTVHWKAIIKEYTDLVRKGTVCFTGGEPLTIKDIWIIADYAKGLGHNNVLFSNACLINSTAMVSSLENSFDRIQISLDGTTAEVHDKIRGDGSFEKVLNALQLLAHSNLNINLAVTIMPANYLDINENLVRFLRGLNLPRLSVIIGNSIRQGRAKRSSLYCSSLNEVQESIYSILEQLYLTIWRPKIHVEPGIKMVNCGYGDTLVISADGSISPCGQNYVIGKYGQSSIQHIYNQINEHLKSSHVDLIEACQKCDLRYICAGGCRINNFQKNGEMRISCCSEERKNSFYSKMVRENWTTYQATKLKGEFPT